LRSDDLDATFDRIAAAPEAEVIEEPMIPPWGDRDIARPAADHVRIEQGRHRDDGDRALPQARARKRMIPHGADAVLGLPQAATLDEGSGLQRIDDAPPADVPLRRAAWDEEPAGGRPRGNL